MKKFSSILIGGLVAVFFLMSTAASCGSTGSNSTSVERKDTKTVGDQQAIYQAGQPLPLFNFSQVRASLIQVETAMANGAATYTVFYSFGKPVYVCPSVGYPIPATTQLTNPHQVIKQSDINSNGGNTTVEQPDPTGVYTGSTNGTYVVCVRDGKLAPIYSEPDAMAFPFPVKIVDGNVVDAGGDSSVTVNTK